MQPSLIINHKFYRRITLFNTVRPRDTRPQAARTSTVHVFEQGPKNLEMHVFGSFSLQQHDFGMILHDFARNFIFSNLVSFFSAFKNELKSQHRLLHLRCQNEMKSQMCMIRHRAVHKNKNTPLRTPRISGLKSQILKPTFLA